MVRKRNVVSAKKPAGPAAALKPWHVTIAVLGLAFVIAALWVMSGLDRWGVAP